MTVVSLRGTWVPSAGVSPWLAARDIAAITRRNLRRILRTLQLLLIAAVQPSILLILFRYVLGGAISVPGHHYVDFVVPGVFLEAVMIGAMATAIDLAEDLKSGVIDRFRSLPMARSAVLAGRTVADLARSVLFLAIMVGLGLAVGFRFHEELSRSWPGSGWWSSSRTPSRGTAPRSRR